MPVYTYDCACGKAFDELFFASDKPYPATLSCSCGKNAKRRTAYRARVLGPVFEHLEAYEKVLFSDRERAQGARIRSASDIARIEKEQGIHREDDTFYRVARDEMLHEEFQIKKVQREDGVEAAKDFVDDMYIKEATGWNQQQVTTWKEQVDAVEKSGIKPSDSVICNGLTDTSTGV